MLNLNPQDSIFTADSGAVVDDDVTVMRQHIRTALEDARQMLVAQGFTKTLATMYRDDPLSAEIIFRDEFFQVGREILGDTFEIMDDFGPSVEVEGEKYIKLPSTPGQVMTVLGSVECNRHRYRPVGRKGKSFLPLEKRLGLIVGSLTPAAGSLSMALLSNMTARESADTWERVCGKGPSVSTLIRLSAEAGRCLEECSTQVMDELRKQEELPENASMIQVGLDGVMMRMNAEMNGDEVIEKEGWREASCGTVTPRDDDGNRLQSRYIGRLPEGKKESLKTQIRKEVNHLRSQKPDLKLVVTADGAKDNWTFSKSLNPVKEVLDFWHATEKLKVAADAAFGPDEKTSIKWFEAKRHTLRHEPDGVGKVIDALRYLLRKGRGSEEIRKVLGYFRNNRSRMNYDHLAKEGYPIGSGEVEAANKMLVTHRLKRSGQRWGRDGGQGVLAYRALMKSDRFDRAWRLVVPKMERSKKRWDPPNAAANDSWQIRIAS